jgi:hypothetical protein
MKCALTPPLLSPADGACVPPHEGRRHRDAADTGAVPPPPGRTRLSCTSRALCRDWQQRAGCHRYRTPNRTLPLPLPLPPPLPPPPTQQQLAKMRQQVFQQHQPLSNPPVPQRLLLLLLLPPLPPLSWLPRTLPPSLPPPLLLPSWLPFPLPSAQTPSPP